MTCVAGIVDGPKVWLGGDSANSSKVEIVTTVDPKVFQLGEWVLGYAGDLAFGDVLRYRIAMPRLSKNSNIDQLVHVDLIDEILAACKRRSIDSADERGEAIVGVRGRLYVIDTDLSIREARGFASIGNGGIAARCALAESAKSRRTPKTRLKSALEIAAEYTKDVRPPWTFVSTGP